LGLIAILCLAAKWFKGASVSTISVKISISRQHNENVKFSTDHQNGSAATEMSWQKESRPAKKSQIEYANAELHLKAEVANAKD
jgi:hypothetical protein